MKETLPRVLDHALDGAVIISLFNGAIVHTNYMAAKILPQCEPDRSIETSIRMYGARHDIVTSVLTSVPTQLAKGSPLAVDHLADLWLVGSPLVPVDGYPPCGILTMCHGEDPDDDDRRRLAVSSHLQLAFAARAALELDQARRDLRDINGVLNQVLVRVNGLSDALVANAAEFPTLGLTETEVFVRPRAS